MLRVIGRVHLGEHNNCLAHILCMSNLLKRFSSRLGDFTTGSCSMDLITSSTSVESRVLKELGNGREVLGLLRRRLRLLFGFGAGNFKGHT